MQKLTVMENGLAKAVTTREARMLIATGAGVVRNVTAGAATLTTTEVAPGNIIARSGPTGAFTDTLPTAALLSAFNSDVADGETIEVRYSNRVAFIATIAGGTGVTAVAGSATAIAASANNTIVLTRTNAAAWTFELL